jgi:hypothetical protein
MIRVSLQSPRAGRPSGQPAGRPALRFWAGYEKCRLVFFVVVIVLFGLVVFAAFAYVALVAMRWKRADFFFRAQIVSFGSLGD